MNCTATSFPPEQTGYFSPIIVDYLKQAAALQPFYKHPVSHEGIKSAIQSRQQFNTKRKLLVEVLKKQYGDMPTSAAVTRNIELLLDDNTFTITTAHQPVIFTGPLYFIYKIFHAIRLADYLSGELPEYHFLPVFYMGSEDADLDELGHIYLDQEKIAWDTKQTGAVGRMTTKGLEKIIARVEGEFGDQPFREELLQMLKDAYLNSPDIQTATLRLVNRLFSDYGLIVLIPDNAELKREMLPIFEDDLFQNKPAAIVSETAGALPGNYKVQVNPREINLFYMTDGIRARIERGREKFTVHGTDLSFDESGIKKEMQENPERFSPNVILRGLFQETILPNIVFIGGGGETAYWLELKNLFEHYKTPFPVLLLRNSFLIMDSKHKRLLEKSGVGLQDIFKSEEELMNEQVRKESPRDLILMDELQDASAFYSKLEETAGVIDPTLADHVAALERKAMKRLLELEKKMLRAEKRKFTEKRQHIHSLKSALFPNGGLQERIDNFIPYYAKWGRGFLELIFSNSHLLEQDFVVLCEE